MKQISTRQATRIAARRAGYFNTREYKQQSAALGQFFGFIFVVCTVLFLLALVGGGGVLKGLMVLYCLVWGLSNLWFN